MTAEEKKSTRSKTGDKGDSSSSDRAPFMLLAASWFVTGFGHWILGRRVRAVVFGVVVVCAFSTGVLLAGDLGTPKPANPFSWLATFACLGNGVLYFLRLLWVNGLGDMLGSIPYGLSGGGSPSAAGFAYGNTFLYTAGLMNLLAVLDASDIARGLKE